MVCKVKMKNKSKIENLEHAKMLHAARNVLNKNGVLCLLTNSALLGAYRDEEMIPHAMGAVLTTFYNEIKPKSERIINELKEAGFKIQKHFVNRNFKIRLARGRLNIEIVGYSLSENGKYYYRKLRKKKKVIPAKYLKKPYSKIKLYNYEFLAPGDIESFLSFMYVDWRMKLTKKCSPSKYKTKNHMVIDK